MSDILELARQAGFYVDKNLRIYPSSTARSMQHELQVFYTIVRNAALRDAYVECEDFECERAAEYSASPDSNLYLEGERDGAEKCKEKIRALAIAKAKEQSNG